VALSFLFGMKDEFVHALGNALLSLKQISLLASRFGAPRVIELDQGLAQHYSSKKFLASMSENSLNKLSEDVVSLAKIAVTVSGSLQPGPNDIGTFLTCFSTLQQSMWALSDEFLVAEQFTTNSQRSVFLSSQLFASAHEMHAVIDGLVKKDPTLPETLVSIDVKTSVCGLVLRVTDCVVVASNDVDGNDRVFLLAAMSMLQKEFVAESRCASLVRTLSELVGNLLIAELPSLRNVIREDITDVLSRLLAQIGQEDGLSIESARKKLEKLERKKIPDDPINSPLPSLAARPSPKVPAQVVNAANGGVKFANPGQLLDAVLANEISRFDFVLTFRSWCQPDEFIQLLHSRVVSHASCIGEMLVIFQSLSPNEYRKHEELITKLEVAGCAKLPLPLGQRTSVEARKAPDRLSDSKCEFGRLFFVHTAEEIADVLGVIDKVTWLFCLLQ
jgi:hypothetical protein